MDITVGIIANPVSARDIRRLLTNASSLQISDRANIVLRLLASLGSMGVNKVLMMPDNGGMRGHVQRGITREKNKGDTSWPELKFLDMPVTSSVQDTIRAVRIMAEENVSAIIVLGGDGTHRAVISECQTIPIAGLSTGTNNAFPDTREPTVTGLATGLYVTGKIPTENACISNKILEIKINDEHNVYVALVDVVITTDRYVGARALWRTETFTELYVTFGEAHSVGMSSIAGLVNPVNRHDPYGLRVELGSEQESTRILMTPIAPGLMKPVGIKRVEKLLPGRICLPLTTAGSIALDGEREIEFGEQDRVEITLKTDAFYTIDVTRIMLHAAQNQLMLSTKNH